jgi:hypothetical protein
MATRLGIRDLGGVTSRSRSGVDQGLGVGSEPRDRRRARPSLAPSVDVAANRRYLMGLMDDAKDTAETAGRKLGDAVEDAKDRVGDKVDEMQADADVKRAERERDAVHGKNEVKEHLRGDA